ncbi:MAG: zinc-dependent metalloprotease [Flavobacteriaceae bacterium]|nr:zinc-dependent metalloprotease [Flavobacteriaceae bacterium]
MKRILCFVLFLAMASLVYASNKNKQEETKKDAYQMIIDSATVKNGLFKVYKKKNDYYFLIPDSLLNKDFLLLNKISSVTATLNDDGFNKGMEFEHKVIQFVKNKSYNRIYIVEYKPFVEVEEGAKIRQSVSDNYAKSMLEFLDIEAYSPDSTAVLVKVNKLYDGSTKSLVSNLVEGTKKDLSYIETVKSFPQNIVVKMLQTAPRYGKNQTTKITSNLVLLPREPMQARFSDKRVGYFTTPRWYFSDEQHQLNKQELITRWRLEPKEEDLEDYRQGKLVEPKKQIVYYIDPATPKQWVSYIIQGVYDWQKAFESAGFKNAIIAKEAPVDDENFDIDDVRYSVITYAASDKANAMGPCVFDPRSGEILEADVIWWHNVMTSVHSWMRVQTGIIDDEARANKFSDKKMGEAIRFVSSHEVGHTLGLKHNMGASYSYPVDSLRSASFCREKATAPSIMDYARFNYVAQPEDKVTDITPKIGAYDKFAIDWGYRYYGKKDTEKLLKDKLQEAQKNPELRYVAQQSMRTIIDPRGQSEDLGDDAVKASEYGLKNLKRLMPEIIKWTTQKGDNYLEAGRFWNQIIGQWYIYAYHTMANVGGVYINDAHLGDDLSTYEFVPRKKQENAVNYLLRNVFTYPKWLFGSEMNNFVYPTKDAPKGYNEYNPFAQYKNMVAYIMWDLLTNKRLDRMVANEAINGEKAYRAEDLLDAMYKGIFAKTIKRKSLSIEERANQKAFLDALIIAVDRNTVSKEKKKLQKDTTQQLKTEVIFSGPKRISEAISLKRGVVLKIEKLLKKRRKNKDSATNYHYEDMLLRIKQSLYN